MKTKEEVVSFFEKAEPNLAKIIEVIKFEDWFDVEHNPDKYFYDLCRTIVGQQLAGKAASAIFARFETCVKSVVPARVWEVPAVELRACGLSWAKVNSVRDLSQKVLSGDLDLSVLQALENEDLIVELSKVKGIGRWTAEMFLMFRLGRDDIFSLGDLGLKNGLKKYLGKDNLDKDEMDRYTQKWSPFRTYGAIAMWHLLDNR